MGTHESSVNYQNLIRDLAEMYPFDVAEVVLVELVANSLDAGATRISIQYDPNVKVLVAADNGRGMDSSQFDEYHDFAAGLKTRGTGIGFAGVGAKVSFNIADRVITETRSDTFSGCSNWYLQSKKRLLWDDTAPMHLSGKGTRVEVRFAPTTDLPYNSSQDLVRLLKRHYLPLLDKHFLNLYEARGNYSSDLRFLVNGVVVEPGNVESDLILENVTRFFPTKGGKRTGYGVLGLAGQEYPLGQDICGVLLCTFGKVIKSDLFNQFPGGLGPRVFGLVEIPALVNFLTTAKTDFVRGRGRYGEFEKLVDPVRQEFKAWLAKLGVQSADTSAADEATKLEREVKKLLDDMPELAEFFGFRTKKNVLQQSDTGMGTANIEEGMQATFPIGSGVSGGGLGLTEAGDQPGSALAGDEEHGTEKVKPVSRKGLRGPKIGFALAPERVDLAWVEGNSVVINSGHPCYEKAHANPAARTLHSLFAIASAVQRFLVTEGGTPDTLFTDRMMASWGKK